MNHADQLRYQRIIADLTRNPASHRHSSRPQVERVLGRLADLCDGTAPADDGLEVAPPAARRYSVR
jgi:hypothetical protein